MLQAIVDCVCKSYRCYQSNPTGWEGVREIGLSLLSLDDLEHYHIIFPDKGDLQDKWEKVVTHGGKYLTFWLGCSPTTILGRRGTKKINMMKSRGIG
jgi:hypothetical protein